MSIKHRRLLPAIGATNRTIDTDGDGLGDTDPNATFAPFSANPEIFLEERERLTVNTALQWAPAEHTEIVFDAMWSTRDVNSTQYGAIYSLLPGSQTGVRFCNRAPNAESSLPIPSCRAPARRALFRWARSAGASCSA